MDNSLSRSIGSNVGNFELRNIVLEGRELGSAFARRASTTKVASGGYVVIGNR